jgi:hypothetical protein
VVEIMARSFLNSTSHRIVGIGLTVMIVTVIGTCCWAAKVAWMEYRAAADEHNIAILNEKVSAYRQKSGKLPDLNLIDLYRQGLTERRLHKTPFGGYYRLDLQQSMVYNPNR